MKWKKNPMGYLSEDRKFVVKRHSGSCWESLIFDPTLPQGTNDLPFKSVGVYPTLRQAKKSLEEVGTDAIS